MIYLDTHVVVWLYAGLVDKLGTVARELLVGSDLYVSPIVLLELQYLFEIQKISVDSATIRHDLAHRIGLRICEKSFAAVVAKACESAWTRDPFDRLIVAHAALDDIILLSKDQSVLQFYAQARWS